MEIRPLRTDEEIREFIAKNYGSYDRYYQKRFDEQPTVKPEPIRKSAAEIFIDGCEVVAKQRKQTLAEFFRDNPLDYQKYRALATSRDY